MSGKVLLFRLVPGLGLSLMFLEVDGSDSDFVQSFLINI